MPIKRKIAQKCLGLILIVLSVIIIYFCAKANNVQDSDATPILFMLPLGYIYCSQGKTA